MNEVKNWSHKQKDGWERQKTQIYGSEYGLHKMKEREMWLREAQRRRQFLKSAAAELELELEIQSESESEYLCCYLSLSFASSTGWIQRMITAAEREIEKRETANLRFLAPDHVQNQGLDIWGRKHCFFLSVSRECSFTLIKGILALNSIFWLSNESILVSKPWR